MGLFEEQIKQRKISDQEIFGESFVKVAGVVLGERAAGMVHVSHLDSRRAIDDILKYYRHKPAAIPDGIDTFDGQLEYALRPHGILLGSGSLLSKQGYECAHDLSLQSHSSG